MNAIPLAAPEFSNAFPALLGIVSGALATLTGFVSITSRRRAEARALRLQLETQRIFREVSNRVYETDDVGLSDAVQVELTRHAESPETKEVIADLKGRLAAIEDRMPARSTVDKLESVNDAILATKIEALEKELKRVSDAAITKWDVATIVFAVLAGMSVLFGLIAGAIKLFG